jgi:hypothetical protein
LCCFKKISSLVSHFFSTIFSFFKLVFSFSLPANPKTQLDGLLPSARHPSSLILYNRLIIVSQQPQL